MATLTPRHPRRQPARPSTPASVSQPEAPAKPDSGATASFIEPAARESMICEAAYYLAERRGFCPGSEVDDWLTAEREIDRALASGATAGG